MASLPREVFSARLRRRKYARILLRACWLCTNSSQSRLGWASRRVTNSTRSPFWSLVLSGTMRPLILAPTVMSPRSVWTRNAKSIGVDPAGRSKTSPLGVNTNTCSLKKSVETALRNSREFEESFDQSAICLRSSAIASPRTLARSPSLYAKWAATPYSAISCISRVRICTSIGSPWGPITFVCRLW